MDDALILRRTDPARNMARFYALSVEPTLFGGASLTRRWGRIGTSGRQIVELHADAEAARLSREAWLRRKARRGYVA
jgi:predicted DNA-binding WGR domain protein